MGDDRPDYETIGRPTASEGAAEYDLVDFGTDSVTIQNNDSDTTFLYINEFDRAVLVTQVSGYVESQPPEGANFRFQASDADGNPTDGLFVNVSGFPVQFDPPIFIESFGSLEVMISNDTGNTATFSFGARVRQFPGAEETRTVETQ